MTTHQQRSPEAALDEKFLIEILSSFVRARSVNPDIHEAEMAECVRRWLVDLPIDVNVIEFAPGRPSIAAVLPGVGAGPRLVLNGHMDTVPIDDGSLWTTDPFDPSIRTGFLYGRGACDMKAGLAAQVAVLHHLVALDRPLQGTLIAHFAAGEERAEPGTLSLLRAGFGGDFGIVTEPTELNVAVAARGLCHFKITIVGRSNHASRPDAGVNPVPMLSAVLEVVDQYNREIETRHHALLGSGTCTPTVVRAGVKENAIADDCILFLDRRLLPGESADRELDELRSRLGALTRHPAKIHVSVERFGLAYEPAEISADAPFARELSETAREVTGKEAAIVGTSFTSDVRNLVNDAGIEAVTFGPGNVAECHCVDERVSVAQVTAAAATIARVASKLLL